MTDHERRLEAAARATGDRLRGLFPLGTLAEEVVKELAAAAIRAYLAPRPIEEADKKAGRIVVMVNDYSWFSEWNNGWLGCPAHRLASPLWPEQEGRGG